MFFFLFLLIASSLSFPFFPPDFKNKSESGVSGFWMAGLYNSVTFGVVLKAQVSDNDDCSTLSVSYMDINTTVTLSSLFDSLVVDTHMDDTSEILNFASPLFNGSFVSNCSAWDKSADYCFQELTDSCYMMTCDWHSDKIDLTGIYMLFQALDANADNLVWTWLHPNVGLIGLTTLNVDSHELFTQFV